MFNFGPPVKGLFSLSVFLGASLSGRALVAEDGLPVELARAVTAMRSIIRHIHPNISCKALKQHRRLSICATVPRVLASWVFPMIF
jgi:hypothetical protein